MKEWMERLEDAKAHGHDAVTALVTERHEFGMTVLHQMAEQDASPEAIVAYVRAGADPDAKDEQNDTPLHWAADAGACDAIRGLVAAGADIGSRNDLGDTPLHLAVDAQTTRVLVSEGADMDAKNKRNETPLHYAADNADYLDIAKALVESGANARAKDRDGDTPLDYARAAGNERLVDFVGEREASNGMTATPSVPSRERGLEATL